MPSPEETSDCAMQAPPDAIRRSRTEAELSEARRQVESLLHKLRGVVRTLETRGADGSRKAQITLAKRRVAALEIASGLIAEALESENGGKDGR